MADPSSSSNKIQNLRNFTVQIRHIQTHAIVGTGFVVSEDGLIATCAHVVVAAGINPRCGRIPSHWELIRQSFFSSEEALRTERTATVPVHFPQAKLLPEPERTLQAKVVACFQDSDDDVVLLKLEADALPERVEVAIVDDAEESVNLADERRFRSYGYRRLDKYQGLQADGAILGMVEPPSDRIVLQDPLQLRSPEIDSGMSGAAVLDVVRDRVVGIISETSDIRTGTDRDTSFAVDYGVVKQLSTADIEELRSKTLISQSSASISAEVPASSSGGVKPVSISSEPPMPRRIDLTRAPAIVEEWVGREDFLKTLNQDWVNSQCHLTGVIGFGGEGKSSLARKWVETLQRDAALPKPDGMFWWGFYEQPNIETFFNAIFEYLDLQDIDPGQLTSVEAKAETIRAIRGRYLFVLDGLEVMQVQEGDDYGLLKTRDLCTFLRIFADGEHKSFCLLTSRFPVLDLIDFTTYHHREIGPLDQASGTQLLQKIGVKGAKKDLARVVADWGGYALSLRWIGTYLVDNHWGNVKRVREIPIPDTSEPVYERLQKVLQSYDSYITQAERELLKVFSLFRLPVVAGSTLRQVLPEDKSPGVIPSPLPNPDIITKFIRTLTTLVNRLLGRRQSSLVRLKEKLQVPVSQLSDRSFDAMIRRLVAYRIVEDYPDNQDYSYSIHPLIRAHYAAQQQQEDSTKFRDAHRRIGDIYQKIAFVPQQPTLSDLTPLIEAVHHYCQSGDYDQAYQICWERISQRDRYVLAQKLGAYDTALILSQEFFPGGDTSRDPLVSSPHNQRLILNEIGFCLMNLGRLAEAPPFYEQYIAGSISAKDWVNACVGYLNLAELYTNLGNLSASNTVAELALTCACRTDRQWRECHSLAFQGWVAHLQGHVEVARAVFQRAEQLQQQIDSDVQYLYSIRGIHHAQHLYRQGDIDYAYRITEANRIICEQNIWPDKISLCYRLLGDLDAADKLPTAQTNYTEALRLARSISNQSVLIEALLARGRWVARQGNATAAASDLEEALGYAVTGGYRIYEADIRIALAWMHRAAGQFAVARREAERAQQMSQEMGYYWGQQDAAEVLAVLVADSPV